MEKKEMSMETRLLLAFLLMGLVLFGTQYLYKPPPATPKPAASTKPAEVSSASNDSASPSSGLNSGQAPHSSPMTAAAAEIPGQIHADREETFTVETDYYRVLFSNKGAVARSWILKNYKDHDGKPLDLVNQLALAKVPAPFSLYFKTNAPATDPNNALFNVKRSNDGLTVEFEFSDGRSDTKKSFVFAQKSYLAGITSQVTENGTLVPHSLAWRGGYGDQTIVNAATTEHSVYYDQSNSKLYEKDPKEAKNGPVSYSGMFSFAGLEDQFFAGVYLPVKPAPVETTIFSDQIPAPNNGAEQARVGAAVGGDGVNTFSFFAGPKDTALLGTVDKKLESLIDWGWFEVIAKPLFLVVNWTAEHLVHNWGWAIMLVTATINFVLFPLRISSMKSSRKMSRLQPQIKAINDRYKSIKLNDPRKQEQNEELMALYKREGVNPVGGCLPMILQLPFFYAFYRVLSVSIQMRGANWLWVHDLSQPETLPIRLLPVILIVTQFLTQRMTPTPGADPSQQKMMMFMPLVLGYMFYFAPSGLVLYWLTSNLVGILQQWLLNRGTTPQPAVIDVKPASRKKK
jgi:YidC/Oxa1 family membrane protein insertase